MSWLCCRFGPDRREDVPLPFLDIIRAEDTSAVITNLALSTVNKIITCRMLGGVDFEFSHRGMHQAEVEYSVPI